MPRKVTADDITTGDVIAFHNHTENQDERHEKPSFGLVVSTHDKDDTVETFSVLELAQIRNDTFLQNDKNHYMISRGNVDAIDAMGLDTRYNYRLNYRPLTVANSPDHLSADGQSSTVKKYGSLDGHALFETITDHLDNLSRQSLSSDLKHLTGQANSPVFGNIETYEQSERGKSKYRERERQDQENGGRIISRRVTRGDDTAPRKRRRRSNTDSVSLPDISLDDATKVDLLSKEAAQFFKDTQDKRAAPVQTLRQIFELSDRAQARLEKKWDSTYEHPLTTAKRAWQTMFLPDVISLDSDTVRERYEGIKTSYTQEDYDEMRTSSRTPPEPD